jgi:glycerol-1-phosphate dehydrogenase [NAD(P)+]
MQGALRVTIPALVRIKPGALDRAGLYAARLGARRVTVLFSQGLVSPLPSRLEAALRSAGIEIDRSLAIEEASFEQSEAVFAELPAKSDVIVGVGGGKALDVAKYVAFLARRPYLAIPTSLSNDGFSSPQSSLTLRGRRRSLPAALPAGVVIDTEVCAAAPAPLFCSGVGDLVAKVTAVADWKLAFHAIGTPVNDFAALMSDATVFQFMARPSRDLEGMRLLGTALLLNGIAMEICGTSRPASGSEHLISHALDAMAERPRLHGLQVGVATYLVSHVQGHSTERIGRMLDDVGFWDVVAADPFSRKDWKRAIELAPQIKDDFYTVLSSGNHTDTLARLTYEDPRLARVFVD